VNTSGDGFLAMFDGPQRAIRCAMSMRDTVQALGLEVGAGLHTGECEIRRDDIGGIAVHIGARVSGPLVAATAHQGTTNPWGRRCYASTITGSPIWTVL
jgi:class 3 adenylate cyclase